MVQKKQRVEYCRNCHFPLAPDATYCYNCGQKNTTGKISFWGLMDELADAIFNLDSKIFRTIAALFIPGKLTVEYFKGRHKRYVHPFRIFLVLAVVQIAVINFVALDEMEETLTDVVDSEAQKNFQAVFMDSLQHVHEIVLEEHKNNKAQLQLAFDSTFAKMGGTKYDSTNLGYMVIDENWDLDTEELDVARKDIVEMSDQSLLDKYEVEGLIPRYLVIQSLRFLKKGGGISEFFMGKLVWMIMLMMPALALVLKLLYIRRKRFYVEHLIFSFHYHAFAFLALSLGILLDGNGDEYIFIPIALGGMVIYLYLAMRRVYQQGHFKTFIKFSVLNWSYTFLFGIFLTITMLISFLLF